MCTTVELMNTVDIPSVDRVEAWIKPSLIDKAESGYEVDASGFTADKGLTCEGWTSMSKNVTGLIIRYDPRRGDDQFPMLMTMDCRSRAQIACCALQQNDVNPE